MVGAAPGYGGLMSIHLIGGGRSDDYSGEVYAAFIEEATSRAAASGRPLARIGVVLVGDSEETDALSEAYRAQLGRVAACDPVVTSVRYGGILESVALSNIDGLLIGGGHTPSYLEAVAPVTNEIRLLVSDGLPYAGFSAGTAIAADRAIIGGWQIGGVAIAPEDTGEDLEELTIVEGLGLVDLAIDVHAAQWGTLSRLIAATEAGLVDGGVAIDEFTALIVGDGELQVVGSGSVWRVTPDDNGVLVGTLGA